MDRQSWWFSQLALFLLPVVTVAATITTAVLLANGQGWIWPGVISTVGSVWSFGVLYRVLDQRDRAIENFAAYERVLHSVDDLAERASLGVWRVELAARHVSGTSTISRIVTDHQLSNCVVQKTVAFDLDTADAEYICALRALQQDGFAATQLASELQPDQPWER